MKRRNDVILKRYNLCLIQVETDAQNRQVDETLSTASNFASNYQEEEDDEEEHAKQEDEDTSAETDADADQAFECYSQGIVKTTDNTLKKHRLERDKFRQAINWKKTIGI